jgi:hypothetical protein
MGFLDRIESQFTDRPIPISTRYTSIPTFPQTLSNNYKIARCELIEIGQSDFVT